MKMKIECRECKEEEYLMINFLLRRPSISGGEPTHPDEGREGCAFPFIGFLASWQRASNPFGPQLHLHKPTSYCSDFAGTESISGKILYHPNFWTFRPRGARTRLEVVPPARNKAAGDDVKESQRKAKPFCMRDGNTGDLYRVMLLISIFNSGGVMSPKFCHDVVDGGENSYSSTLLHSLAAS